MNDAEIIDSYRCGMVVIRKFAIVTAKLAGAIGVLSGVAFLVGTLEIKDKTT